MHRIYLVVLALLVSACVEKVAAPDSISPAEARNYMEQTKTVCGKVSSGAFFEKAPGKPTYINLGKPFPDQEFTITILGEDVEPFNMPVKRLREKSICVTGLIQDTQGVPVMIVTSTDQLLEL
jgi:hypothetical protein